MAYERDKHMLGITKEMKKSFNEITMTSKIKIECQCMLTKSSKNQNRQTYQRTEKKKKPVCTQQETDTVISLCYYSFLVHQQLVTANKDKSCALYVGEIAR
jgi:hypothetical protein